MDQRKRRQRTSDSDSDDDLSQTRKIYADGYDDKLQGNADDRAWLKSLPERQREEEIMKRHEQREILKHREEIVKKMKTRQKSDDETTDTESKSKSNTYDNDIYAAEDDDDEYRSSANRRKQVNANKQKETEHSKNLQLLIEERRKKQGVEKSTNLSSSDDETDKTKKQTWKVNEVFSSSGSDSSDDEEEERGRSRSPADTHDKEAEKKDSKRKKCTAISTKAELKPMIISRFRMEKWCHAPFFANVVKGAFVRINIGQNNGKPVYRLCEIRDVVETAKIYNLGSTRTNKGLRLKHGHNERVFRLEFVSNSDVTDNEFQRWREALIKQGSHIPTLQDVENKSAEIEKSKQHVLSNNDISKIVKEKNRFRKAPINYAMSKNELQKEIDIAREANDAVEEARLRKQFDEMEQRASELDRRRTENISIISQINQRNRKNTQHNVEQALAREAIENRNAASDPFTRRRCAPTLVSKAPQTKEDLIRELHLQRSTDEAAAAITKKKEEEKRLLEEKAKSKTSSIALLPIDRQIVVSSEVNLPSMSIHERGTFTSITDTNDELFSSHNFELDLVF